jgi:hypothetical protein
VIMKRPLCLLLAAALCFACGKKTDDAAARQAKLNAKKKQEQRVKAIKAYRDLVTKYPNSTYAPQAQERLNQLAPPTPAK